MPPDNPLSNNNNKYLSNLLARVTRSLLYPSEAKIYNKYTRNLLARVELKSCVVFCMVFFHENIDKMLDFLNFQHFAQHFRAKNIDKMIHGLFKQKTVRAPQQKTCLRSQKAHHNHTFPGAINDRSLFCVQPFPQLFIIRHNLSYHSPETR